MTAPKANSVVLRNVISRSVRVRNSSGTAHSGAENLRCCRGNTGDQRASAKGCCPRQLVLARFTPRLGCLPQVYRFAFRKKNSGTGLTAVTVVGWFVKTGTTRLRQSARMDRTSRAASGHFPDSYSHGDLDSEAGQCVSRKYAENWAISHGANHQALLSPRLRPPRGADILNPSLLLRPSPPWPDSKPTSGFELFVAEVVDSWGGIPGCSRVLHGVHPG
jgi:hypothetical protein